MSELSILDPDFEQRSLDVVRRATDDIQDCDQADIAIIWPVPGVPMAEFIFRGYPQLRGRPSLAVQLVTESRSRPLARGRVLGGDELRRKVREDVETYLKAHGIVMTRKVFGHASL